MTLDLRERILHEAATRFVASGYHAVSMREVAEAVNASKAAIYYHFTDKEALLLAIMEQSLTELIRIVNIGMHAHTATEARLVAVVAGLLGLNAVQRAAMRLAMFELQHLGEVQRKSFAQRYDREFIERLRTILRDGQHAGDVRTTVDIQMGTWALLGLLYPFALMPSRGYDVPTLSRTLVELFLRGVRG
ncbi:MAG: TetR/AcrR family transcriptional regulator [Roseiflexaceae bacterium]|jgi:AcrR family transcriptional regulator|nr:TetR/AcrR family transcriptional regulator [Chloroflexaceae bacterium]